MPLYTAKPSDRLRALLLYLWHMPKNYWQKNWFHKGVVVLAIVLGLSVSTMYGIARWYMWSERDKPLTLGASFIADYAEQLGLNPHQTFDAILYDLGVKHVRLVSYWNNIEPKPGKYNFSELDWEFQQADAAHAKVTLSVGLRQPRWPECHPPSWINTSAPDSQWEPALDSFITTVVNRYKNNQALDSYQVENEYFLTTFGQCTNFDRSRLVNEFDLVRKLDPHHPLIISRSNNAIGTPIYAPIPDQFGVSVYKRVWDTTITHRYVEYPFPAWYYGFLAGTEKILTGKDTIIHELQAEPWPPNEPITSASPTELNKSMNAKILANRFQYGEATGMKTIDLWGAEYWYYAKVKLHDPSMWNVAKQQYAAAHIRNARLHVKENQ